MWSLWFCGKTHLITLSALLRFFKTLLYKRRKNPLNFLQKSRHLIGTQPNVFNNLIGIEIFHWKNPTPAAGPKIFIIHKIGQIAA